MFRELNVLVLVRVTYVAGAGRLFFCCCCSSFALKKKPVPATQVKVRAFEVSPVALSVSTPLNASIFKTGAWS